MSRKITKEVRKGQKISTLNASNLGGRLNIGSWIFLPVDYQPMAEHGIVLICQSATHAIFNGRYAAMKTHQSRVGHLLTLYLQVRFVSNEATHYCPFFI